MAGRPKAIEGKHAGEAARWRRTSDEQLVAMVRSGDTAAFEAVHDRHSRELLAFCRYMLGCRQDAEDALQSTFASAYRALRSDRRDVVLRPWLFTIARNVCVSVLRQRRSETDWETPMTVPGEDPCLQAERREDVRHLLADLMDLPERQRVAIVLAELHGFTHGEIAEVMGVRADQVKSYVFQARSALISDREARCADCDAIREELAAARGSALLRGHLRRHLRACEECRGYAEDLARQRRRLGALLPLALALLPRRGRGLPALASADGASGGGATLSASWGVETAEGGSAVIAKMLAGVALLGAGTGAGTIVLGRSTTSVGAVRHARMPGSGEGRALAVRKTAGSGSIQAPASLSRVPSPRTTATAHADVRRWGGGPGVTSAKSAREAPPTGSDVATGMLRAQPRHGGGTSRREDSSSRGESAGAAGRGPAGPRDPGAYAHGHEGGHASGQGGWTGRRDRGKGLSSGGAGHAPASAESSAPSSRAGDQAQGAPPADAGSPAQGNGASPRNARDQAGPSDPGQAGGGSAGRPAGTSKGPSGPPPGRH